MSEEAKKTETPPAETASSTKGSSPVPVILAVVNILFTIGIGAIVFLQFQKDKHRESVTDIQVTDEHAAGEHGEKKEGEHGAAAEHGGKPGEHAKSAKKGDQVITLDQFTVNLSTSPGTPPRFARVVVAIEVPSTETAQEVAQKMAPVRNAILDLFNSKRPGDLQTGEGRNFLKEEIRNALNGFLITGKVKGVFFSNFVVGN